MQTSLVNSQSMSDEEIRGILAEQCLPSTAPNRPPATVFIIDGKFETGSIKTLSGEKRTFTATLYTVLNEHTYSPDRMISAIRERRLARVLLDSKGLVNEIHVHPEWMQKMKQHNALEVVVRYKLDGTYRWLKENDDIGIGSVGSEERYEKMVYLSLTSIACLAKSVIT